MPKSNPEECKAALEKNPYLSSKNSAGVTLLPRGEVTVLKPKKLHDTGYVRSGTEFLPEAAPVASEKTGYVTSDRLAWKAQVVKNGLGYRGTDAIEGVRDPYGSMIKTAYVRYPLSSSDFTAVNRTRS